MMSNRLRIYYWLTFGLSVLALVTNIGIGLIALAIILLPVMVIHVQNGLRFKNLSMHKSLVLVSATNLLIFALIRPDGVHVLNENGLSSLLGLFGIHTGYNSKYETELTVSAILLLVLQIFIELSLRKKLKSGMSKAAKLVTETGRQKN